jgi:hypothetical protein
MTDETIRVEIEGETPPPPPSRSSSPPPAIDESELTRRTFADLAEARRELLEARRDEVATRLYEVAAKSDFAKKEIERANEAGDFGKLAEKQQEIAQLEAQRHSLNVAADQLARIPAPVGDPIEAFISGRAPATQAWLRAHPDDARALALSADGSAGAEDQRRSAKINAAHNDAIAEGFAPDTPAYFNYVENFLEQRDRPNRSARSSSDSGDEPKVNFVKKGQPVPKGHLVLTKGEYERSLDGSLTWNYGSKKGQPIGPQEYARRKIAMEKTHPPRVG